MPERFDVVIVGGGIAGGALAAVLQRFGVATLVLEKTAIYPDLVRGEWLAPWGVVEAQRLGIYEILIAAGGHHVRRNVRAGEGLDPEEALAHPLDMTGLIPGIPGPLCLRHPVACQALIDAAVAAGATVECGVRLIDVEAGATPAVTFAQGGRERRVHARLLVGADGRNSSVRRRAGIAEQRDITHHLFTGLLVEQAHGWPDDLQVTGSEHDVHYLAFPQGQGRVRLYLGYALEQKRRFTGPRATAHFLDAFRLQSLPGSEHLADATPISLLHSYPNEDVWSETPYAEGLLLIGDAAGHNDPIIGQGLSITLRDVRHVCELLLGGGEWTMSLFAPYAERRNEDLRRLRFTASIVATLDSEFTPEALARRLHFRRMLDADPTLGLPLLAAFVGPEQLPAEAFSAEMRGRILAPI